MIYAFLIPETGERDVPETLVHPDTQSWQRRHDPKDPEHHRCGVYNNKLWWKGWCHLVFKIVTVYLISNVHDSSQVLACKDTGYDWFEQLLQNVSFLTFAMLWFLNSTMFVFINGWFWYVLWISLSNLILKPCSCWSQKSRLPTNLPRRLVFSWWTIW